MRNFKQSRLSLARCLKLSQLVVFEAVVAAGSILAAWGELALTQPAVSKSLHELERYLDQDLFVRSKKGVALTEFGRLFERHARTMLLELRCLSDGLNAWQMGVSGHVVVGTLITASAVLVPEAIHRLRGGAPDVEVEVRVGTNTTLFPALARGDLDVVVGYLPRDNDVLPGVLHPDRLQHQTLYDEALCVVVDRQHPLAARQGLTLRELHDQEWILPTPDSVAYGAACAMFDSEKLPLPARVVYSVSVLTNMGLLRRRPMVALMPQLAAQRFEETGLLSRLSLGPLEAFATVGYSVSSHRQPSAACQRFIEALRASV